MCKKKKLNVNAKVHIVKSCTVNALKIMNIAEIVADV